ncbi:MAG: hypothetical protein EBY69_06180, partial [Burkholderiaceae bacterium]|nr:hypothetical protein [Burkholderiaceae bacterium]
DPGALVRVPGIGKKTAERLLLELKGKLAPDLGIAQNASGKPDVTSEVIQALVSLGYSDKEAHLAIRQIPVDTSVSVSRLFANAGNSNEGAWILACNSLN